MVVSEYICSKFGYHCPFDLKVTEYPRVMEPQKTLVVIGLTLFVDKFCQFLYLLTQKLIVQTMFLLDLLTIVKNH